MFENSGENNQESLPPDYSGVGQPMVSQQPVMPKSSAPSAPAQEPLEQLVDRIKKHRKDVGGNNLYFIIGAIVVLAIIAGSVYAGYQFWQAKKSSGGNVVCAQDAKQCADGSYVSRVAPKCDFAACPEANLSIAIISPNGGENWALGSSQTIEWSSIGNIPEVTISLVPLDSSIDTRMLGTVPNNGSFSWVIPNCNAGNECSSNFQIPTGNYKIQISGSEVSDESDVPFGIISDPTADWKTYENEQYGFEVKYPKDWTFSERNTGGSNIGVRFDSSKIAQKGCDINTRADVGDNPFSCPGNGFDINIEDGLTRDKYIDNFKEGSKLIVSQTEDIIISGKKFTKITFIDFNPEYIIEGNSWLLIFSSVGAYDRTDQIILSTIKFTEPEQTSAPADTDSDNDGLDDLDEVKYGTDAQNPDSDSDGYLDGEEVQNGYDPLGPGKLQSDN